MVMMFVTMLLIMLMIFIFVFLSLWSLSLLWSPLANASLLTIGAVAGNAVCSVRLLLQ